MIFLTLVVFFDFRLPLLPILWVCKITLMHDVAEATARTWMVTYTFCTTLCAKMVYLRCFDVVHTKSGPRSGGGWMLRLFLRWLIWISNYSTRSSHYTRMFWTVFGYCVLKLGYYFIYIKEFCDNILSVREKSVDKLQSFPRCHEITVYRIMCIMP